MNNVEPTSEQLGAEHAALEQRVMALETALQGAQQDLAVQFRALVENALVGIYIIQNGRYRYVNPRFAEIFGYTPEEIVNTLRHGHELIAEVDRPLVRANVARRLRGEVDHLHYTFRGKRKDGSLLTVEVHGSVMDYEGQPAVIGTLLDVTHRQQTEDRLRANEQQMRTMTETLGAAVFIFQGTQMRYANPAAERISGYHRDELCRMPFWQIIHPDYRDLIKQRGLARQRREPVPTRYEVKIITKSGAERWVDFTGGNITFEGQPAVLGTAFDITERKVAEEALRESEERFRRLVELSPDAVVVHSGGTIVFLNTAGATLIGAARPDDLIGASVLQFVHPDYQEVARRRMQRVMAGGTADRIEEKLVRLDGQTIDVEVAGTRTTYQGRPAVQLMVRDITDRKRLENQLRQAQKMEAIGTLAGGIAHDFNNILAAIIGYTELATFDIPRTSPAWRNLQEVLTAGHRAKELVQQILTFSRPRDHRRQPVRLHLLVKETLNLLRATLPSTITINNQAVQNADSVLADPTQLHQVLMNLCTNAEHAMRSRGGNLDVGIESVDVDLTFALRHPPLQPGPHVRLTVRDTGHGIPPEVVDRIFEPFFTTKDVGEGSGMGLAVAHGIVTSHGGAITVDSTPDVGTTFAIYLPCIRDTSPPPGPVTDAMPQGQGRILVVDDEDALTRMNQDMLERLGYEVVTCSSGPEALERFRAEPEHFDLVLTDQTMPALTGRMLTEELRRLRPDIPIVLCTGFSHVMNADKAREMGIDAFLLKPLSMQTLARTLQQILRQRSA